MIGELEVVNIDRHCNLHMVVVGKREWTGGKKHYRKGGCIDLVGKRLTILEKVRHGMCYIEEEDLALARLVERKEVQMSDVSGAGNCNLRFDGLD